MTAPDIAGSPDARTDSPPTADIEATRLPEWIVAVLPIILILLAAVALRAWQLTTVPPGLTHDEANHGREAIGILNGVYLYFFPLNYGSEPLYSYTAAAGMGIFGRGVFALRIVNVVFGVAAVAMVYVWAARRLGRSTALLGAGLIAVSFWPVVASRAALRAGMLPFFMTLVVWFFWRILEVSAPELAPAGSRPGRVRSVWWFVLGFAVAVALTLHIYLAARVAWLLFPAFMAYLAVVQRTVFRKTWRPVLAGLALAALLVVPMFLFLRAHPEMQTRLGMFDGPLQSILAGDWRPIWLNARDALLAFVWPGFGDQFLAYNIPGRPVLNAISAVFFVAGVLASLWRWRSPVHAFLLLWLLVGIGPSLVTGPTANTTRNLVALPAVYLITAIGFIAPAQWLLARRPEWRRLRPALAAVAVLWLAWTGWATARDYFVRWGDSAEVRGAYQHTLVEALDYLESGSLGETPLVLSTVYPGPAHDSSIALVLAADPSLADRARWVDARLALAAPGDGRAVVLIPASTPPHPLYEPFLRLLDTQQLRPDDLDPAFALYELNGDVVRAAVSAVALPEAVNFNDAVELIGASWQPQTVRPGETAALLTVWRVLDPTRAGPLVPPSFTTDAVTFTHVLDDSGAILAQYDSLDAPSWAWQSGDLILQVHPVVVPPEVGPGDYRASVGIYDRQSGDRLPLTGGGDAVAVPPLEVVEP